jgi:hypothetical protein
VSLRDRRSGVDMNECLGIDGAAEVEAWMVTVVWTSRA